MASGVETAIGAQLYTITDLGILNGGSTGYGLNDLGQVTGGAGGVGVGAQTAFIDTDGTVQSLGTLNLGIPQPGGSVFSFGSSINDTGQVAGTSFFKRTASSSYISHAFRYDVTSMQDLGTLGGVSSTGSAINKSGTVVGWSDTSQTVPAGSPTSGQPIVHAFIYQNGTMKDLGTMSGFTDSAARAINSSGWVTGSVSSLYGQQAFIYNGSKMSLIPTPAGYSVGNSINSSGWVAGTSAGNAFLYAQRMVINLGQGFTGSAAEGINDSGYVVGYAKDSTYKVFGMVYDGSTVLNLNQLLDPSGSDWYISNAFAINNGGQILATGSSYFAGIGNHTLLLTPVPEPDAGVLMIAGLSAISIIRRRSTSSRV